MEDSWIFLAKRSVTGQIHCDENKSPAWGRKECVSLGQLGAACKRFERGSLAEYPRQEELAGCPCWLSPGLAAQCHQELVAQGRVSAGAPRVPSWAAMGAGVGLGQASKGQPWGLAGSGGVLQSLPGCLMGELHVWCFWGLCEAPEREGRGVGVDPALLRFALCM